MFFVSAQGEAASSRRDQTRPIRADHAHRPGRYGGGAAGAPARPRGLREARRRQARARRASRRRRRSSTCCSTRRASPRSSSTRTSSTSTTSARPTAATSSRWSTSRASRCSRCCAPAARASASTRSRPARLIADTAEGLDAAHELRSMSGERARARPSRRLARQHRRALQRPGEARRFRRREGDAVGDADGQGPGQVQLHGAREAQGRARRSPQRHLLARLRDVGSADAQAAVPRRQRHRDDEAGARAADPAAVEGQQRRPARATTRS